MKKLRTILIIDDDPIFTEMATMIIKHWQLSEHVISALNGKEGLALLQKYCGADPSSLCPDLILLDINMPVMNGFEFLEEFQHLAFVETPQVIVCTSSQELYDLEKVQKLGVIGNMGKPFKPAKLQEIMEAWEHQHNL
ncbi:Response regulator receiver domain-containing protein [Catalinimonas alkaloidigena]|uniref:Response regulator receiver domain-containing protein n=1 Tax=Catalinimonas alkaloidigena TaxID=1075417 RepID=A0A1G9NXQ1_9BACT|nr:response regulator [Catalinimonas alkaloidigena]SDL91358.1 Response regulator receiver domain-containing protein [Catalinimonas alkaloidigena]